MDYKKIIIRFVIPVLIVITSVLTVLFLQKNKHVKIDEWSSRLVAEQLDWAEVAKGYGTEKCDYDIPTDEYNELISLLKTVTEDARLRKNEKASYNDYYLAIQYEQKIWIFNCYDDGSISLVFDTPETAEYYGYSSLIIDSPELWEYIINTVNSKASK